MCNECALFNAMSSTLDCGHNHVVIFLCNAKFSYWVGQSECVQCIHAYTYDNGQNNEDLFTCTLSIQPWQCAVNEHRNYMKNNLLGP